MDYNFEDAMVEELERRNKELAQQRAQAEAKRQRLDRIERGARELAYEELQCFIAARKDEW